MININRNIDEPESLQSEDIKIYIEEYGKCLESESTDKPKKPKSYRQSDLLDAFNKCFYSKCYLTEEFFENSWAMDVEHFVSQSEDYKKIYEWNNLYPAEHKANMSKPRKTPNGGYLDPCNKDHNVEEQIIYSLTNHGLRPNFDPSSPENIMEINTVELLDRVHNGHNDNTKMSTVTLRHAIQKKYINILEKISEYSLYEENENQKKIQLKNELKFLLSRKASYTMLCRSIPAVIQLNEKEGVFFD
jgi:hypothetical protein